MTTIVLTGPESSGKTTLAQQLSQHFGTAWVPEYARSYLQNIKEKYTEVDLLEIAKGQLDSEIEFEHKSRGLLFLDTSFEVLKIWSEYRFGKSHPFIRKNLVNRKHDLYLVCRPDLEWEFDPQRENPKDREVLFQIYLTELTALNANFVEIAGVGMHRFENALKVVDCFQNRINTTNETQ